MTHSSLLTRAASLVYTLLWCLALPILLLSPRLRQGWWQRCGWSLPDNCDLWIQGASAGECALISALLQHPSLKNPATQGTPLRVLATSCTAQGLGMFQVDRPDITLVPRYLPFDLPALMRWALRRVAPKAVVLVETELWPGLLLACARCKVPVIVINARMTSGSLAGYLTLAPLLRTLAPERIVAIAPEDALRFGLVFGAQRVSVTGNMKFDRALNTPDIAPSANPLAAFIPPLAPFLVLGSVREEEENQILELITHLRTLEPTCVIGLFPRHTHRCDPWYQRLMSMGLPVHLRSTLEIPVQPGDIIIGDRFGELNLAYALAQRAFVGGSLTPLGGQNFLEPLAYGVQPAVGPYTRNFAWVGEEIFTSLVHRSADLEGLARILISPAPARTVIAQQIQEYLRYRHGATRAHCEILVHALAEKTHA